MIVPALMAAALCAGLFLLFGIHPIQFAAPLFARRKKSTFKNYLFSVRGMKKQNFFKRQFAQTDEILRVTGREKKIPVYRRFSFLLAVAGACICAVLVNPSLEVVLALFGLLVPQFFVQMSAYRFKKECREELFTALSLVTSSYERLGSLTLAVEENIEHIHPPIDGIFSEFLRQSQLVDADVPRALTRARSMLDNAVWREWCDAMQLCIANPAQRKILRGVVEKCGQQNNAQNELDAQLPRPFQQMLLVMGMVIVNVPIICFLFNDFTGILFYTIQGKCGLALMAGAVLFAVYRAVRAARPVKYRKAVKD